MVDIQVEAWLAALVSREASESQASFMLTSRVMIREGMERGGEHLFTLAPPVLMAHLKGQGGGVKSAASKRGLVPWKVVVKLGKNPIGLTQLVLTVLFLVLQLARLPTSPGSLRLCPWTNISLMAFGRLIGSAAHSSPATRAKT